MPYREETLERIKQVLYDKEVNFAEKKMFSGVCIMVDEKMCLGTHIDKKTGEDFLLCRMSEADCAKALKKPNVIPMEFTGKAMKGYVFVKGPGFKTQKDLAGWIQMCLDFNPEAKRSKK